MPAILTDGNALEAQPTTDDEWFALDALLQRLTLCSRGLAAESFRDSAYQELDAIAADPEARTAILGLIPSEPELT